MVSGPPARWNHTAIWTGSRMIIHGGTDGTAKSDTWSYSPTNDSWTSLASAAQSRDSHAAVWNGTEMFVWGGRTGGTGGGTVLNTGGRYHPGSNTWSTLSTVGAPVARMDHTAVWTGNAMIVWGGNLASVGPAANTGGVYDPAADSWRSTTAFRVPRSRAFHTATWIGDAMMIFGGYDGVALNSLHTYSPPKTMFLYQKP